MRSEAQQPETTAEFDRIDPITCAVIQNGLIAATLEMTTTLKHAGFNPLISEIGDYSTGITDARGRLWGEAPGIISFLGPLPAIVGHGVTKFGASGFEDGDAVVANDPSTTGTHVHDTSIYSPVFVDGELIAFTCTTSHWGDLGGMHPGGWAPDSYDVYQEGMQLPHVRLMRAGEIDKSVLEIILANSRLPDWAKGDIDAQIAACRTGEDRVVELCKRYGTETVRKAMESVLDASERAFRAKIAELPDGEYAAEAWLDHDNIEKDIRRRVFVSLTIEGDRITADTTGSSETAVGPVNLGLPAARGGIQAALKSILTPYQPANDGELRVPEFVIPYDTIVNPLPNAACDQYAYVLNSVIGLTLEALAPIAPDRCPAGSGGPVGIYLHRQDAHKGTPFICFEPMAVGWGGSAQNDGAHMLYMLCGASPNYPSEIIEARYPVLVKQNALNVGSGGAGQYRGGLGVIREYEALEEGIMTESWMEFFHSPPKGVLGGTDGRPHRVVLRRGTPEEQVFTERFSDLRLAPGQSSLTESAGGGGWGDPRQRDPRRVLEDVRNEYVSNVEARDVYGVVLRAEDGDFALDEAATAELRGTA